MKAILLAAMLLLTLAAPATAAGPRFDRDCMDSYGRDLCDAGMLKAIRESFGAPPVDSLVGDGWSGVRVYLVDGYSNDLPMVTIARKAGGPLEMESRVLRPEGGPRVYRTGASEWAVRVSDLYAGLVRESPLRVGRPAAGPGGPPVICLHAWVAVVEVFDAKAVHRRVRNACGADPVFDGGLEMSRLAFEQIDGCHLLDKGHYRGHPQRLEACARLNGDPLSVAAFVRNRIEEGFSDHPSDLAPDHFAGFFAADATLERGGAVISGREATAAAWTSLLGRGADLQVLDVTAVGDREVKVRARIIQHRQDDRRELAQVEQTWIQDKDYRWRMQRASVGPYTPLEPRK